MDNGECLIHRDRSNVDRRKIFMNEQQKKAVERPTLILARIVGWIIGFLIAGAIIGALK